MKRILMLSMGLIIVAMLCNCRHVYDVKRGMSADQVVKEWGKTPDKRVVTLMEKQYIRMNNPNACVPDPPKTGLCDDKEWVELFNKKLEVWTYDFRGGVCRIVVENDIVIDGPKCEEKGPSYFSTTVLPALAAGAASRNTQRYDPPPPSSGVIISPKGGVTLWFEN